MENPFLSKFISIRPFTGIDEVPVSQAAEQNAHSVLAPSHVVLKEGKIVGALEIATSIPVLVWAHTEKMGIRDSLDVMRFYENLVFGTGNKRIILPCKKNSPFLPYLKNPKSGYVDCGEFNFFLKKA